MAHDWGFVLASKQQVAALSELLLSGDFLPNAMSLGVSCLPVFVLGIFALVYVLAFVVVVLV